MGIEYLRRRLRYFVRPVSSFRRRIRDLCHLRYRAPERPLFLGVQGCLDAALRITHDELARTARLEQDFTSALPTVLGGDGHLRLVFLLLIRTALQAMARDSSRQHVLRVRTRWEDGWARVSFSDTSQGISEKQWPFILDEGHLHTPNDSIEAHGLPISRAILQAMGGELQVESQEGGGITYTVLLPEAKRTRSESPSPP